MDLCDLNTIKSLLGRHGFHFSKSMGQNFLIQDWVPRGLVEGAGVGPENGVLEIGPGIGGDPPRRHSEAGHSRPGG